MAIFDISAIEKIIGYSFNDKMILRKCFVHASYGNEHGEDNNELFEFFGDSIIQYVVTEFLFKNSPGDEGKLTAKRAEIVSKNPLLRSVKELGLHNYVLLGRGQEKYKTQDEKLYSSIYEALVAGIYLDGGMAKARKFIKNTIIANYIKEQKQVNKKSCKADSKNAFQEYVQKKHLGYIGYQTLSKTGPDHLPEFRVVATLNGIRLAEGKGLSKKEAEACAAVNALAKLKLQDGERN